MQRTPEGATHVTAHLTGSEGSHVGSVSYTHLETIRRKRLNPQLQIEGILLTMADTRASLTRDIQQAVEQQYGHGIRIFRTVVRRSVRFAESAAAGRSLIAYDSRSAGANAYRAVAKEIIN